jgi:archaetidylinositol phosphate synthase
LATTYTHRLARALVKPLIGTPVTPNHLTTLRLLTGLGACLAVAVDAPAWRIVGAILWLISAFLDRADGELARIGNMMSEKGHQYDYLADVVVNSLVFTFVGIGARHGWLGLWGIPLGLLTTGAMLVCWITGEAFQKLEGSGAKAYQGRWGFDLDDGLYLLAIPIWLNLMGFVLLGAASCTVVLAIVINVRLHRLKSLRASRPEGV